MNLIDLTSPELIVFGLEAENKEDLLTKMAQWLVDKGNLKDTKEVVGKLMEREKLMSTGIKDGFAIPHCFTEQLGIPLMMIAMLKTPVDYQALDEKQVKIVFLLLGPQRSQGIHLKALARLARLMSKDEFLKELSQSKDPADFYKSLKAEEEKFSLVS